MSTVVIRNTVTDPTGRAMAGIPVRITLVTATAGLYPGITSASSITSPQLTYTDATGAWQASLTPNTEITQPANTYYQVSEGDYVSNIIVPPSGGPYELSQVITGSAPTPGLQYVLAPATFTVEDGGSVVAARPAVNLIAGTNVQLTVADNPGASRVDVTITSTAGGAGPSGTVTDGTSFGETPAAGTASTFSRGDHGHGTPALGTTGTTAAAGNDSRITGAAQKSANLSDLADEATARTNLGLGSAATQPSSAFDAAGAAAAVLASSMQKANDLSDVANTATARANLGVAIVYTFSKAGTVAVATGAARLYNDTGHTLTITAVRASVGTAPVGSSLIVDIKKNGITIFTNQANRPTIAAAAFTSGKVTNMDVTALADGDYLTVDVAQVGSTTPGSDLTVTVYAE